MILGLSHIINILNENAIVNNHTLKRTDMINANILVQSLFKSVKE